MQEEETILPSFSPLTPSLASSSQLGAPCLLQHYNSLGGHFRPIKPASRDSTFSLCLLLLLVPHNHSVISTLDTKALSLTNQFGRFNDWGRQGRNRKKASCWLCCLILVRSRPPGLVNFRNCLACAGARALEKIITGAGRERCLLTTAAGLVFL